MKITSRIEDQTLVLALQGRLDAFHGGELQKVIDQNLSNQQVICVIMDMSGGRLPEQRRPSGYPRLVQKPP